jgi:hypothetical protein
VGELSKPKAAEPDDTRNWHGLIIPKQLGARRIEDLVILCLAVLALCMGLNQGLSSDAVVTAVNTRAKEYVSKHKSKSDSSNLSQKKSDSTRAAGSKSSEVKAPIKDSPKAAAKATKTGSGAKAGRKATPKEKPEPASDPTQKSSAKDTDEKAKDGKDSSAAANAGKDPDKAKEDAAKDSELQANADRAVNVAAVKVYALWAIWAVFLVATIWESAKSLTNSTTKKLAILGPISIVGVVLLLIVAGLVTDNLYAQARTPFANDSIAPLNPIWGICQASSILLLLNLVQLILYKRAPSLTAPTTAGSLNTSSALAAIPTMAQLSGLGAAVVAGQVIAHPPGLVEQASRNTVNVVQAAPARPDPNLLALLQSQNEALIALNNGLQTGLSQQKQAFDGYQVELHSGNNSLRRLSGGLVSSVRGQTQFYKGVVGNQGVSQVEAAQSLNKLHRKSDEALNDSIDQENLVIKRAKLSLGLQISTLKAAGAGIEAAKTQLADAKQAWIDNKIPFASYRVYEDAVRSAQETRDQKRHNLAISAASAENQLVSFKTELARETAVAEAARTVELSHIKEHNLAKSVLKDTDYYATQTLKTTLTPDSKFIDDLAAKFESLATAPPTQTNEIWESIEKLDGLASVPSTSKGS